MFDMLLESGRQRSLLPSWAKGVALTLHVSILAALWRSPASPAPLPVVRGIDLPPVQQVSRQHANVPTAPIVVIDDWTLPLPSIDFSDLIASSLSAPAIESNFAPQLVAGPALQPGDSVYLPSLVQDAPALLSAPTPVYPPLLRSAGVQGRVIVAAVVDTLGQAENGSVRIVLSDHPGFDAAALATVRAARFRPARIYGRAVRVLVQVPVVFRLN